MHLRAYSIKYVHIFCFYLFLMIRAHFDAATSHAARN